VTYNGTRIVHAVSQGINHRSVYSTVTNLSWSYIRELPTAREFHSLKKSRVNIHVADTKWYPVEYDDTTTDQPRVYDLWYLYARFFSELPNLGAPFGLVTIDFDVEVKGSQLTLGTLRSYTVEKPDSFYELDEVKNYGESHTTVSKGGIELKEKPIFISRHDKTNQPERHDYVLNSEQLLEILSKHPMLKSNESQQDNA
jgi:hypothetical protein